MRNGERYRRPSPHSGHLSLKPRIQSRLALAVSNLPPLPERTASIAAFFSGFCFRQPPAPQLFRRDTRKIRLDVEDRSSFEHINAVNIQPGTFTADQLNYSQADRARPIRRSRREHAVLAIVCWGPAQERVSLHLVEHPDDKEE